MKTLPALLAAACLAATIALPVAHAGELPPTPWAMVSDPPRQATTAPSARINPSLKLNVPWGVKLGLINPARPLIVGIDRGIAIRDLLTNTDRGGVGADVEYNGFPAVSLDGRYLALARGRGFNEPNTSIGVYDARSGKMASILSPNQNAAPLVFVDNTRFLVTAGTRTYGMREKSDCRMLLVDATNAAILLEFPVPGRVSVVRLSPGGKFAAVVFDGIEGLAFYDLSTGKPAGVIVERDMQVQDVAFSPDGSEVAYLTGRFNQQRLTIAGLANGQPLTSFDVNAGQFGSRSSEWVLGCPLVQYFTDGRALLVSYSSIYERQSGRLIFDCAKSGTRSYYDQPARWVISADQTVAAGPPEKQRGYRSELEVFVEQVQRARVEKAVSAVASGGDLIDIDLPPETSANVASAQKVDLALPGPAAVEPDGVEDTRGKGGPDPGERLNDAVPTRPNLFIEQLFRVRADLAQVLVRYAVPATNNATRPGLAIERVDLNSGQLLGQLETKFAAKIMDCSPDGTQVLVNADRTIRNRLDVFTITGKGKHVVGWKAAPESGTRVEGGGRGALAAARQAQAGVFEAGQVNEGDVVWAGFLDNTRVLTLSGAGLLTCWELPACRAVYTLDAGSMRQPLAALSNNRKQIALVGLSGLAVLDAATGKALASFPVSGPAGRKPAFSASGRHVAAAWNDPRNAHLFVADLTGGKDAMVYTLPTLRDVEGYNYWTSFAPEVQWLTREHVLLGSQMVIDTRRGIPVWRVAHAPNSRKAEGVCIHGRYVYPSAGKAGVSPQAQGFRSYTCLTNAPLPSPETLRVTASYSIESMTVLSPGMGLTVNGAGLPDDFVRKSVVPAIQSQGYRVEPGQKAVLSFTTSTRDVGQSAVSNMFNPFFANRQEGTVTQRETIVTATLVVDGREVWRDTGSASTPTSWTRGANESSQTVMDRELANYTQGAALAIADRFPMVVFDLSCLGSAPLPGADGQVIGEIKRATANAREDQEIACIENLTRLMPQVGKLQECAAALIDGAQNKSLDIKAYQTRLGDLERLRSAMPSPQDMDGLLPAETEAYRKILDTSSSAIKSLRSAANIYNATRSPTSGGASSGGKANEFLIKASGQFNGTVKSEAAWLSKRLEELKARHP